MWSQKYLNGTKLIQKRAKETIQTQLPEPLQRQYTETKITLSTTYPIHKIKGRHHNS